MHLNAPASLANRTHTHTHQLPLTFSPPRVSTAVVQAENEVVWALKLDVETFGWGIWEFLVS